jgi:transposase
LGVNTYDLIGPNCTAAVTSDRYAGYAFIDNERQQVCWAHLLRDFYRIGERHGLPEQIGRRLLGLGLVMFRKRDKGALSGPVLQGLQRRIRVALEHGAQQCRCSRTANTCAKILKLWTALWTFTTNKVLAPTNNAAEQALRSIVLKRKISGPTCSLRDDQFVVRGFSVHEPAPDPGLFNADNTSTKADLRDGCWSCRI